MLRRVFLSSVVGAALLAGSGIVTAASANDRFLAICYHDVLDQNAEKSPDGVSTEHLAEQLNWLRQSGYQAVSISDVLAAQTGKKALPAKAVLLTFDDGYESFYTRVFPLLQSYKFPAVLAIVDEWIDRKGVDTATGERDPHENGTFLTWEQIREMQKSGLIEIASHTHDSHHGITANPQGNAEPAVVTNEYFPATASYETVNQYRTRLNADFEKSSNTLFEQTGVRPRVMVWPYGAYNKIALSIAQNYGMPVTFSLEDGFATVNKLKVEPRYLVKNNPSLEEFVFDIEHMGLGRPVRVIQADLDYIYDADAAQMERNLDAFIQRIHDMDINTVFLQAFADPEGDGFARSLYFPNRHMPVRADLFARVVWQLKTRAHVRVYGWLPVMAFDLGDKVQYVTAFDPKTGTSDINAKAYKRTSLFDTDARSEIADIYEDMARTAAIDGILFHDDALLSDFEDDSNAAHKAYVKAGLPATVAENRANEDRLEKWTTFKTESLIAFTQDLARHARKYRAPLKTARNIYAPVVIDAKAHQWFSQDYTAFLKAYDYTAIMAMPRMENVPATQDTQWLSNIVDEAKKRPNGLDRTVFELQAVDWNKTGSAQDRAIPAEDLGAEMRLIASQGGLNLGYYPDDYINNVPDISSLHKDFSLQQRTYLP